jgi:uroporphyrinogen decarboxylase
MNSRDRVLKTLRGEIPDRVPVMEMFIDHKVINSICPGMSYEDFADYADMDVVTCLTMADSPENIKWVDRKKGLWRDKWGALQMLTEDIISINVEPAAISSPADMDKYIPPDPAKSPVFGYAKALVDRFKGKRAITVIGEETFAPSQYVRAGLSNLMIDYVERPDLVRRIARIGVDYHVELYRKLIKEGVEIIVLGDDYAGKNGTFMSPAHFKEFILPGLATVAKAIKDAGGYCIKHTDGDIWKIMDMLLSTSIDMLGPLEPAYMDLVRVRKYSGGKMGVLGNVDVDLLSRGTTDEVRLATKNLLRRVSPLGGHILASGNSISSSVKGENFMAMLETCRQYGKYPIHID